MAVEKPDGLAESQTSLHRGARCPVTARRDLMPNVWWCNQTKCWTTEHANALVCAAEAPAQRVNKFRRMVEHVRIGDIAVHYRSGIGVVAVSRALTNPKHGVVTTTGGSDCWQTPSTGWYYTAEYFVLQVPIPKLGFISLASTLRVTDGPFVGGNRVRQAYFMPFHKSGLDVLRAVTVVPWPTWALVP